MIKLGSSARERLQAELLSVIPKMSEDMRPRLDKISKGVKRWEAKSKKRTWPLGPRTSSVHIPLVAIIYDSILANGLNALLSQDRDVNVTAYRDDEIEGITNPDSGKPLTWFEVASAIEEYLLFEYSSSGQIPYRDVIEKIWHEGAMTGTAIPCVTWETRSEFDFPVGASRVKDAYKSFTFDNLRMEILPSESFLFPLGYDDPSFSRIPILTHRFLLRPGEIRERAETYGWDQEVVSRFLSRGSSGSYEMTDDDYSSLIGESQSSLMEFEEVWLCESWMRFPLDGKNEFKIVVTHALDDPTLIFNISGWPYAHGKTKFSRAFRYLKRRNRLLGMGIPERLESIDEAFSTVINQAIDAATIANVPIWSVDENVPGVRSISDLYPGAVIKRGDDVNAITPLKNLGPGPDLFEVANILRDLGERVSHVSDYSLGRQSAQLGKEGTATGILSLLRETGSYRDSIIRDARETGDDINWRAIMLIAQFKPIRRMMEVMGKKKAQAVLAALSLKPSELNKRISIRVASSNSAATAEIARQEEQAKFVLMMQYNEKLILLADSVVQKPWLGGLAAQIAKDMKRRVARLLEAYSDSTSADSLPDLESFIPAYQEYGQMIQQVNLLGNGGGQDQSGGGNDQEV